jgi:hypothetical protein
MVATQSRTRLLADSASELPTRQIKLIVIAEVWFVLIVDGVEAGAVTPGNVLVSFARSTKQDSAMQH